MTGVQTCALPISRDDPQFRRNRERIMRDAERENIGIEWDLGLPEAEG